MSPSITEESFEPFNRPYKKRQAGRQAGPEPLAGQGWEPRVQPCSGAWQTKTRSLCLTRSGGHSSLLQSLCPETHPVPCPAPQC